MKRHGLPRAATATATATDSDAWANLRLALDEDMDRERLDSDFHVVHDENYYNRLQHSAKSHRWVGCWHQSLTVKLGGSYFSACRLRWEMIDEKG